jgi:FKBP-type peptidyl-prolyl cis-trans isomerase/linker histone H1 and H5 family
MAPKTKSPKAILDMVIDAIRNQPPSANGVSRVALTKYMKQEFGWDNKATVLNAALKKAVKDGRLSQTGQSFRVVGDPVVELPPEPTVDMEDLKVGKGAEAMNGDTVVMKYEGKLSDGTVFDSADTFEFTLGAGDVIKGWDIGIKGMKVGGQRKLSVPSKLGYGKRGSAPDIPPNADLFFVVTMKQIR